MFLHFVLCLFTCPNFAGRGYTKDKEGWQGAVTRYSSCQVLEQCLWQTALRTHSPISRPEMLIQCPLIFKHHLEVEFLPKKQENDSPCKVE